jgi:hypothetical protein
VFERTGDLILNSDTPEIGNPTNEWYDYVMNDSVKKTLPEKDRYLEHTKYADGSARRWQMWFDGVWQRMSR